MSKISTNEDKNCRNHSLCFGDRKFNAKMTDMMGEMFPDCKECLCR